MILVNNIHVGLIELEQIQKQFWKASTTFQQGLVIFFCQIMKSENLVTKPYLNIE